MATKTFGKLPKSNRDYIEELYSLVGVKFPLSITSSNGKLLTASYETAWTSGGTVPVESTDSDGNTVTDYEENYTKEKLTAAQIKKIDAYLEENIEA